MPLFISRTFGGTGFGLGPGHRVTWYIGGKSRLPVVEMSWGKSKNLRKIWGPEQLLFSIQFSNLKY